MDLKKLEQLAKTCRRAGIKSYKDSDCEFTLSDEAPQSNYKKKQVTAEAPTADIETDTLTDEAILFWSTGDTVDGAEGDSQ